MSCTLLPKHGRGTGGEEEEKNVDFLLQFSLPPLPICGHHPETCCQIVRSARMDDTDTEGIGLGCYGHVLTAEKTPDCLLFLCIWSTPVLHSLEEECYFAHLRMLEVYYHM